MDLYQFECAVSLAKEEYIPFSGEIPWHQFFPYSKNKKLLVCL